MTQDDKNVKTREKKLVLITKQLNQIKSHHQRLKPLDPDQDEIILIKDALTSFHKTLSELNTDGDLKEITLSDINLIKDKLETIGYHIDIAESLHTLEEENEELEEDSDDEKYDDQDNTSKKEKKKKKKLSIEPIYNNGTSFSSLGGMSAIKPRVQDICLTINNSDKVAKSGGDIQKSFLFYGPPGTGKTELAKAIATSTKSPIIMVDGATFASKYIGDEKKLLEKVLRKAENNIIEQEKSGVKAPSIVLFFDEIEELVKKRSKNSNGGTEGLITLMTKMNQGMLDSRIIIGAATNKYDLIEEAILSRFKNHIHVPLPNVKERYDILNIITKNTPLSSKIDLKSIAKQTIGLSGRDLKKIAMASVDEMVIRGSKTNTNPRQVSKADFNKAAETEILGLKSAIKINKQEKERLQAHEAAHAVAMLLGEEKGVKPLSYVTVIPRDTSFGHAAFNVENNQHFETLQQLKADLISDLAGRAGEEILCGDTEKISTGAYSDIQNATNIISNMICAHGFSSLGLLNLEQPTAQEATKSFSINSSQKLTDTAYEEAKSIAEQAYEEAKQLLRDNAEAWLNLTHALGEKETIERDEIIEITGIKPKKPSFPRLKDITPDMIRNG